MNETMFTFVTSSLAIGLNHARLMALPWTTFEQVSLHAIPQLSLNLKLEIAAHHRFQSETKVGLNLL